MFSVSGIDTEIAPTIILCSDKTGWLNEKLTLKVYGQSKTFQLAKFPKTGKVQSKHEQRRFSLECLNNLQVLLLITDKGDMLKKNNLF